MDPITGLFNVAYSVWNYLMEIAMTLFTTSPSAASGGVYTTTRTLYNVLSSAALPIMVTFFYISCIQGVISTPPDQQFRKLVGDIVKLCVMIAVVSNLWTLMGYVMNVADQMTDALASATSGVTYELSISDELEAVIEEATEKPSVKIHVTSIGSDVAELLSEWCDFLVTYLLFLIAAFATLIAVVASGISIISAAYQRILKPLVIMPFSSIAVAMGAGSGEGNRIMASYLKTFVGFCLSGAFMVICIKLGVALSDGLLEGVFEDMDSLTTHEKVIFISLQNMVTPIMISGLVKSTDSMIGRFF